MKANGLIKRLKKGGSTSNKTVLASERNYSPNDTEYSKFLFSSQTKPMALT